MNTINYFSPAKRVRVLVVDDHPSTATTLARAIAQMGPEIDVISANSGETALELVHYKPVDILITDMMMTGINGLELIEKLQSHPGGRPEYTILITAYDVPGLKITARRLKVNEVIIKPVRPERMCQIVSQALDEITQGTSTPKVPEVKPTLKVLVADDLPDNVALLSRYLENEGYACLSAANGEQALAKTRLELPDLVLLDMNMPVMDGFETLQKIRSDPTTGHIPVIILTAARLEPMDMQSALNMGADDYVTKPFDRRELLARIRTRLRVKEAEDVIRRRNRELNLLPEIGKELSGRLDVDDLTGVVLRRTVETLGAMLGHLILMDTKNPLVKTYRFSTAAGDDFETHLPPLAPILARINDTRQGFIISELHKDSLWPVTPEDPTRSIVVVPLLGRFELLGLLVLAHEQPGYFSLEHMLLLQAIASQAAIAVENMRLHETVVHEQQRMAVVLDNSPHSILMFDENCQLVLANRAGEQLFPGIILNTPIGRGQGYDELFDLVAGACKSKTRHKIEITGPDGRHFSASFAPTRDGGCTVFFEDALRVNI